MQTECYGLICGRRDNYRIASLAQDLLKPLIPLANDQKNDRALGLADSFLRSHSFEQLQRRHKHTKAIVEVGEQKYDTFSDIAGSDATKLTSHCPSQLLLVDHTAFHHELHVLGRGDILQWISRNRDHICKVTKLERADLAFPAKQFCAIQQIGLQRG